MPFNNQRNSRDDKSKRPRSNSESFNSKGGSGRKSTSSRGDSFGKSSFGKDDKKTFGKSPFSKEGSGERRPFNKTSNFSKEGSGEKRSFDRSSNFSKEGSGERRPFNKSSNFSKEGSGERRSFDRSSNFSKEGSGERRSFDRSSNFSKEGSGERRPFNKSSNFSKEGSGERRPFNKSSNFSKEGNGERRSFDRSSNFSKEGSGERRPFNKSSNFSKEGTGERRSFDRSSNFSKEGNGERRSFDRSSNFSKEGSGERKPFNRSSSFSKEGSGERRSFDRSSNFSKEGNGERRSFDRSRGSDFKSDSNFKGERRSTATPEYQEQRENNDFKYSANRKFRPANKPANKQVEDDGLIRLNRYISNAGVCSRRKADELIGAGVVTVNGEAVTELGTRVDPAKDDIRYNNERLKREKMVYILLNKPKDYITTTDDPQERRTVMQLVAKATKERIYPVGRLDRNTTGLLLLTNDGNLADKLSHPKNGITKMYQVELNKNLAQGDFNKIQFGLELEDGLIKPDDISYVSGASKREVGIQIHSGKNRIVRRIFESLGYEVVKLDRVVYANLTKKDLPRGRWRYLEEKELIQLKHLIK
ncbi:pseudouridine synthase [Sphingobacterium rhinopitheci]|uniref:pseudouridine synthase n=1 Tax=Sphingobacterium rhinopitheci TaxID=2781960 RepID=UPI001F520A17|nr:pseudouridine synthase [Sphingobacterium rhinopitheci]MCI0920789.1 rRNA pseudouridine synthase [Sphingobacterium rhinopitheci]